MKEARHSSESWNPASFTSAKEKRFQLALE
jgi:hypothetical protein